MTTCSAESKDTTPLLIRRQPMYVYLVHRARIEIGHVKRVGLPGTAVSVANAISLKSDLALRIRSHRIGVVDCRVIYELHETLS